MDSGRPHRYLVLVGHGRQHGAQPSQRPLVRFVRQVDRAAPAVGVFEGGTAAQCRDGGVRGGTRPLPGLDHGRAARHAPQRRVDTGVAERLHQREAEGEPAGYLGVLGMRPLFVSQQGEDTGEGPPPDGSRERVGQFGAALPGPFGSHNGEIEADGAEPADDVGGGPALGAHGEPVPGRRRSGPLVQHPPAHAVPPGVDAPLPRPAVPPGGQRGQHLAQGLWRHAQRLCESGRFRRRQLLPQSVRHRGSAARRPCAGQPEPLALEGVGGQVDPGGPGAVEDRGPVDGDTPRVGLADGQEHAPQAAFVPAQRAEYRARRAGRVQGLLDRHGQHGMRADLDVRAESLLGEGADGGLEADGAPQVPVPVPAVHRRGVQPLPRHRGEERYPPLGRLDPLQRLPYLLLDTFHVGGVRRVVHIDPPGPHPVLRTGREQFVEGVAVSGHHHGRGTVDRGHRQPPGPAGQPLLDGRRGQRQ